jgi:hypothetical protein
MLDLLSRTVVVEVAKRAAVHVPEAARVAVARFLRDAPQRALSVVGAQDRRASPWIFGRRPRYPVLSCHWEFQFPRECAEG